MNIKKAFYLITHWENWTYWVKYVPLAPAWLWYCLRSRSFWFFTTSNPTLTFGGFEGESKKEMYAQLPCCSYPRSIFISPGITMESLTKQIEEHQFAYPIAVKPDVGMMGFLFRKIDNAEDLQVYHEKVPVEYIIQQLVDYPLEVSVFYYRFPNSQKGTITGFLRKDMMEVEGDGKSTLEELIHQHPKARYRVEEMRNKHSPYFNDIIPAGEKYRLSWAANLSRGGKMINLSHENDDRLLKVFDDLSLFSKHFYYGRYDVKCKSIEDLKAGKNFSILEYNGSGAEPHHVYGDGNSLLQAYKILLQHWHILYKISKYNHRNGIPYWKFMEGWRFLKSAKKHFKVLKQLDGELL